jgi:hypothetical protein
MSYCGFNGRMTTHHWYQIVWKVVSVCGIKHLYGLATKKLMKIRYREWGEFFPELILKDVKVQNKTSYQLCC